MSQILPYANSAVVVAFVVVVVLTLIMTFVPPNKSPLYRVGRVAFLLVIVAALALGVIVLGTTVIPH